MSATAAGTTGTSNVAGAVPHYSMLIEWSDEDRAFLVRLPEWEAGGAVLGPVTHGESYAEAVSNGQEALDSLIASWRDLGWELPAPHVYAVPTGTP